MIEHYNCSLKKEIQGHNYQCRMHFDEILSKTFVHMVVCVHVRMVVRGKKLHAYVKRWKRVFE